MAPEDLKLDEVDDQVIIDQGNEEIDDEVNLEEEITVPDEEIESGEEPGEKLAEGAEKKVESPATDADKKKSGVQKRIDTITKQKGEAIREAERLREENERLRAQTQQTTTPEKVETEAPEPKEEEFENFGEYQRAYSKWLVAQDRKQFRKEMREELQNEQEITIRQAELRKKMNQGREQYEKFDDIVSACKLDPALVAAVQDSEIFPDLAYFIATHPDTHQKLQDLVQISPVSAIKHLGVVEKGIMNLKSKMSSTQTPNKKVGTPEIVEALDTGGGNTVSLTNKRLEQMSHSEFRKMEGTIRRLTGV